MLFFNKIKNIYCNFYFITDNYSTALRNFILSGFNRNKSIWFCSAFSITYKNVGAYRISCMDQDGPYLYVVKFTTYKCKQCKRIHINSYNQKCRVGCNSCLLVKKYILIGLNLIKKILKMSL